MENITEKEKFFNYLARKREEGLLSINFTPRNTLNATEEEIYAELNRMAAAKEEPDLELFPSGKLFF